MDMKGTKKIFRTVALTVALIAAGQSAWAQNTFSVTNNDNVFTITRSGDLTISERVYCCTANLSALADKHYEQIIAETGKSRVDFESGESAKTVTVDETPQSSYLKEADKFQNGTTRSYRFLVLDKGGFLYDYCDREITSGTSVPSSGIFNERQVTVFTDEKTITEAGYNSEGRYNAVPIDNYFSNAAPQSYLNLIGAKLNMTVGLEAKEENDGYQHIQILVNETNNCDDDNSGSNPGTIGYSHYLACFSHKQDGKETSYASYSFPVLSVENGKGADKPWDGNTVGDLKKQVFRDGCRASNGKLIIPTDLTTLGIRFDAGGESTDTWIVKNVMARITAIDDTAPDVFYRIGQFSNLTRRRGNPVYYSVEFTEIVKVLDTPILSTTWGDLSYIAGDGTNVLTFSGVISADATGNFAVNSFTGDIVDLAGNQFDGSKLVYSTSTSLESTSNYEIKYTLNGGSVTPGNPTTYNYDSQTFTLNNPTRAGYTFTGWTGSNGTTPQTTVTIPKGSHGDLKFTANWSPVTLMEGTKDGVTVWWGTFFDSTHNYTLGEGVEAYTMGSDYHLYRLGTNGRTIPKNTAVVIIATKATPVDHNTATIQINPAGTDDLDVTDNAPGKNILHGSDSAVPLTGISGNPYVMSLDGTAIGFRKYVGSGSDPAIPAHKAYYVE